MNQNYIPNKPIRSREKQIVDIDPNASFVSVQGLEKHIVKTNDGKYIAKNSLENIQKGLSRFIIVDKPFEFNSPMLALEAVKFFETKRIKTVMEKVYV